MKHVNRIVPVTFCLAALVLTSACSEQGDATAANVRTTSQTKPESKQADAPKPAEPAALTADLDHADTKPVGEKPAPPPMLAAQGPVIVKAEPSAVDFGEIPTMDSGKATVKLINTGETPMTINSARASCGCTTLKFQPNTILPAGETIEVELQMTGGPRPGPLSGKTVTFVVEGQPEIVVPLKGQAVSFVAAEPSTFDPVSMPEGKFKLRAIDGKPFRIMSMMPAVITDPAFPTEPQTEFDLSMSWEKFRELGVNRFATLHLDHPKCQSVQLQINFSQEEIVAATNKKAAEKGVPIQPPVTTTPVAQLDPDAEIVNLIKEGKNEAILQKINAGFDPNHRDSTGLTLLGTAAKFGNVDLIQQLLSTKRAEIEGSDNIGRTPLMHAATSKHVEAVRVLLDAGANPTVRDNLGGSALSWAAWMGDANTVREMIDAGSEVEVVGSITGWTPLMLAAGFGDPAAIEPLVNAGANVEAADFLQGATPLIHASRTGRVESIKALVAKGANIENADRNGLTPLLAAASTSGGDADKLKALIDAGANVQAKNNQGYNALDLARKRTDIRAEAVINVLTPLLGANTPAVAEQPKTPAPQGAGNKDHDHAGHSHDHGHNH